MTSTSFQYAFSSEVGERVTPVWYWGGMISEVLPNLPDARKEIVSCRLFGVTRIVSLLAREVIASAPLQACGVVDVDDVVFLLYRKVRAA